MKKMLLAVLLLALVLLPATAAERASKTDLAVGLNLGTNSGVGVQYRMNDFDVIGNLGFDVFDGTFAVDAAANYKVAEFSIEKADFDVTVGGGVALNLGSDINLAAIVPVGVAYHLENNDFPLDFYFRTGPAFRLIKESKEFFGWYGALGALWRF
ncbi:MAG: hypothetical protein AB7D92_05045 [Sphaerochaeta sp.]